MDMEDYLISTCVIAVLAQRLVRKLCSCKKEHNIDKDTKTRIGLSEGNKLYQPNGCDECSQTGYKGRVAIAELLVVNDHIRKMIVNHELSKVIQQEAIKNGMKILWQDGIKKVAKGIISLNELERVTDIE
jgi:general secretion pathway protein E